MSEAVAPAETYQINTLACAVGRFAIKDIDQETVRQANELVDLSLEGFDAQNVPAVPHTQPELLEQAVAFDRKLQGQLRAGPASELLARPQVEKSLQILTTHEEYCLKVLEGGGTRELLVEPTAVAQAYGLPDMWDKAKETVEAELERYGKMTQHPAVPPQLAERVGLEETQKLVGFMWQQVLGVKDSLTANIYMTGLQSQYHLFWTPAAKNLDYTTPATYDRATQLSFDVPHNVAHLAHLTALDSNEGAHRYDDSMGQRAYFEAVAVLSERVITDALEKDPKIGEGLAELFRLDHKTLSAEQLTEWMIQDRKFEFKLRAARLYADMLIIEGATFEDTIHEVAGKLGITPAQAEAETKKYLPWTGLGAVYTLGYRRMLETGTTSVPNAIRTAEGQPIRSWAEYNAMSE